MKWWPKELESGDAIRIKVGSIYHFGIYVSDDEVIQFGHAPMYEKNEPKDIEVIKTGIEEFAFSHQIEALVLERSDKAKPRKEIIKRARESVGMKGYNIIHNNCEHFVNYCVFGYKFSAQEKELKERWMKMPYLYLVCKNVDSDDYYEFDKKNLKVFNIFEKNDKICFYNLFNLIEDASLKLLCLRKDEYKLKLGKDKGVCSDKFNIAYAISNDMLILALSNKDVSFNKDANSWKVECKKGAPFIDLSADAISFLKMYEYKKDKYEELKLIRDDKQSTYFLKGEE